MERVYSVHHPEFEEVLAKWSTNPPVAVYGVDIVDNAGQSLVCIDFNLRDGTTCCVSGIFNSADPDLKLLETFSMAQLLFVECPESNPIVVNDLVTCCKRLHN